MCDQEFNEVETFQGDCVPEGPILQLLARLILDEHFDKTVEASVESNL